MTKRIATGRTATVTVVVVVVLIAASALILANREGGEAGPSELPGMTLVYETYGPAVTVGDNSVEPYREIRRLEYRSRTDWTETVIESPTIDLGRYGSGSNIGAYLSLNGTVLTEHDPLDGRISESTIDDGVTFVPNAAFTYVHITTMPFGDDVPGVAVTTEARVCFNGDCEENATGVRYTSGRTSLVVFEGDNWIIPLEYGEIFSLRSADIQAQRP